MSELTWIVDPTTGDLIVEVGGVPVTKAGDLQDQMVGAALGKPLEVEVLRDGRLIRMTAVPAELR